MVVAARANPLATALRLFQSGRVAEAERQCALVLRHEPRNFGGLYLLGVIRDHQGKVDEAITLLRKAVAAKPRSFEVLAILGTVLLKTGQHDASIECLRAATAIDPRQVRAHDVLGVALLQARKQDDAIACFRKALAIEPNDAEANMHLGSALLLTIGPAAAIGPLRAALAANPGLVEARHQLAICLLRVRRHDEALEHLRRIVAANPTNTDARYNLSLAQREAGELEPAIASLRAVLASNPGHVAALNALGNTLKRCGALDAALIAYNSVLVHDPNNANALSMAAFLRRTMCDWTGIEDAEAGLIRHVRNNGAPIMPFPFLAVTDDPADQLACARQYWRSKKITATPPAPPSFRTANDRLRLGYLSADFHAHATAYLMAQLFEEHDRSRFEVLAFAYGPDDGSPMRRRLTTAFDGFFDLRQQDDAEAARLIADQRIDILVDLKGHTEYGRLEILASRPAPVQAHYIGYPGTLGTDFIDYQIVDSTVVGSDEEQYYAEKLAYLPVCYQVNDRKRAIADAARTRVECGLPEDGFVFCNFNSSYKITAVIFDVWMRLLAATPASTMWLLSDNKWADDNLRREAAVRGVAPDRLVFAPREAMEQHLARQRLADLFLDTSPYNAHTTASDALWVGLPVLTFRGRSFASRVACSLLQAVHLPELVADGIDAYERLALAFAHGPARLAALRRGLEERILTAPLFDTARTRRNLEAAYREMWTIHCRGEPPRSFHVTDEE